MFSFCSTPPCFENLRTQFYLVAYCVYIIQSQLDGCYYKGYSEHPLLRLNQHNNKECVYTSHKTPWVLVYVEEMESTPTSTNQFWVALAKFLATLQRKKRPTLLSSCVQARCLQSLLLLKNARLDRVWVLTPFALASMRP